VNFGNVVTAIQSLRGKETCGTHFSWVDKNFHKLTDVKAIIRAWRWEPKFDENGNICGINFDGEKYGDDGILFNAIAPYVEAGSYIEMVGEDGAKWRWIFDGETCEEKQATISWE
jgi:hypothetical protein